MFDVWMGDIELTTFTLIFSIAVLLPIQLLLCFKVKSKVIRLLPVILLSISAICFVGMAIVNTGWDGLGYLFLAIFAGFMLFICGMAWGIWAVVKLIKKQVSTNRSCRDHNSMYTMNFKIVGNRPHIRTHEELTVIDKNVADNSFKKYKKELIDCYLKNQGFVKYKANAYVRRNKIDLIEYIDFQKERYGSKTFTVNIAVTPLYIHHDIFAFGFSKRLGTLICNKDVWWDYATEDVCEQSMKNVQEALEVFALSWFHQMEDENYVLSQLIEQKKSSRISNHNQAWLTAIQAKENTETMILENIAKLKLPKQLMGVANSNCQSQVLKRTEQ